MEISYNNEFKGKGHHCATFLIRCMDFRFHKALEENMEQILGESSCAFDSPGVGGGGSKSIIDEESRRVVFSALNIAMEKHGVNRVVIADHIDCGAYGGSGKFANEDEEEKFHVEKLKEAKRVLEVDYKNLEIVLIYQSWNSIKTI
ncbi:MAG: hypothetical protein BWY19_00726 [bacterium ADurb.Bin212]|nr:MAG: hypothetical protein BWY19_00726 [bacterium ADurb.Bin212]